MSELVWCVSCGGPGKTERDALGVERIVCDAYRTCPDEDQEHAREALALGLPDWMVRSGLAERRAERDRLRVVPRAPLFDQTEG